MRFVITSVDHAPDELHEQTPIRGRILRPIPGPDRPDYHVAVLDQPLRWKKEEGEASVSHIILAARWVGGVLAPTMRHTPVNIAYVVDPTVLTDGALEFKKCATAHSSLRSVLMWQSVSLMVSQKSRDYFRRLPDG